MTTCGCARRRGRGWPNLRISENTSSPLFDAAPHMPVLSVLLKCSATFFLFFCHNICVGTPSTLLHRADRSEHVTTSRRATRVSFALCRRLWRPSPRTSSHLRPVARRGAQRRPQRQPQEGDWGGHGRGAAQQLWDAAQLRRGDFSMRACLRSCRIDPWPLVARSRRSERGIGAPRCICQRSPAGRRLQRWCMWMRY